MLEDEVMVSKTGTKRNAGVILEGKVKVFNFRGSGFLKRGMQRDFFFSSEITLKAQVSKEKDEGTETFLYVGVYSGSHDHYDPHVYDLSGT